MKIGTHCFDSRISFVVFRITFMYGKLFLQYFSFDRKNEQMKQNNTNAAVFQFDVNNFFLAQEQKIYSQVNKTRKLALQI